MNFQGLGKLYSLDMFSSLIQHEKYNATRKAGICDEFFVTKMTICHENRLILIRNRHFTRNNWSQINNFLVASASNPYQGLSFLELSNISSINWINTSLN